MRRHEHEQRRTDPATASPREPESLPAEATLLGLQRTAGNRAVRSLLARQPGPGQRKPSTSTLGLGEDIGVIPLESANLGRADQDGNIQEITVIFVGNDLVPKLHEMHLKGTPVDEGFYSSVAMRLNLKGILISAMTVTEDREHGDQIVSMTLNCTSVRREKAP